MKPSCGPLGPSWRHVGSYLAPSSATLTHLGGHLGALEALLEPSWAILGAPTPRGTLRPGPGEGVGGGVNPSPEQGKEEVLAERRQSSLNHLRPEGWWDYLEACWAISRDLGGHVGLSGALLEPSWAILDALTAREAPRPSPGGGGRGRGKPLPRAGEEGVVLIVLTEERETSLDHLSPRGLVG